MALDAVAANANCIGMSTHKMQMLVICVGCGKSLLLLPLLAVVNYEHLPGLKDISL